MADLTRNGALSIFNVTSSGAPYLGVAELLSTRVSSIRALSGGSTLINTADTVQFPFSVDEKIGFIVSWAATAEAATTGSLNLKVKAGDGYRAVLGNYNLIVDTGATGSGSTAGRLKRWILGPFESARFAEEATSTAGGCSTGDQAITFELTTDYIAGSTRARGTVNILPFTMPVVEFAT